MILIGTKNSKLAQSLKKDLEALGAKVKVGKPKDKGFLDLLYSNRLSAIVCDERLPIIADEVAIDILNSLGNRLPVVVLGSQDEKNLSRIGQHVSVVSDHSSKGILAALSILGTIKENNFKSYFKSVPFYNQQIPIHQLKIHGGVGILLVDSSSISKIGLEYGIEVYTRVKEVFQGILFQLWGKKGSFRESDILCRKHHMSNTYYIFLGRSRLTGGLPYPGALEKVADRLTALLQVAIWDELAAKKSDRLLPDCVTSIPLPSVGYVGILANPCIDPLEIIDNGLENAKRVALAQTKRLKERQLEMMQALIQSDNLLKPHYQGIFHLQKIDETHIKQIEQEQSLKPLSNQIFGFESLLRFNKDHSDELLALEGIHGTGLKPEYLRPDVLFSIAKATKVSLELDQACLQLASFHGSKLPGILLVNILPRNLYYIDRLLHLFTHRKGLMFEVSESEAINNFELMNKSCALLKSLDMRIVADDFGRGFSSLERIIKIKPSIIKFDRSMIENIHMDPIKQAYVQGMVEAAKLIDTTLLAEGVEKWEEARVLKDMGIDLIQGFLLHRPESATRILEDLGMVRKKTVA